MIRGGADFGSIWGNMTALIALETCATCGTEIPYAARECICCGVDVGFPNVRSAERQSERDALQERVKYAQAATAARGCGAELEAFGTAVVSSQAVMARSLGALDALVNAPNQTMVSFHRMVTGGRVPENNEYDINRQRIEGTIHPMGVWQNIIYAALALDGRGVAWYGPYSITFKDLAIQSRSSVFEENPFRFLDNNPVSSTGAVLPGYRASWSRRAELAMAKLHHRVQPGMTEADFPAILLEQGRVADDSDFVEVHIYGVLHPRSIERVVGPAPIRRADKVVWKRVKKTLIALGAVVEEV